MNTNTPTQLPDEVVVQIEKEALEYGWHIPDCLPHIAYRRGATEYASKLHQAQQEIESLKQTVELHLKSLSIRNEYVVKAMALLEKFISRHEAGLFPDMFIYNEIKT